MDLIHCLPRRSFLFRLADNYLQLHQDEALSSHIILRCYRTRCAARPDQQRPTHSSHGRDSNHSYWSLFDWFAASIPAETEWASLRPASPVSSQAYWVSLWLASTIPTDTEWAPIRPSSPISAKA
ncbi:hypothetical protein N0V93_000672 [Gnomoniopsis smithogilvyi]|uniref:Uncharacterized protein n=1 Tax=Gnomoniopsis smithogilvyi TaxID=1191159 RepID=A0A9W9D0Y1_9PEZI|nr:hypothetical protein N0V93_000672 [Gnomoniopsis smithogilvyi]